MAPSAWIAWGCVSGSWLLYRCARDPATAGLSLAAKVGSIPDSMPLRAAGGRWPFRHPPKTRGCVLDPQRASAACSWLDDRASAAIEKALTWMGGAHTAATEACAPAPDVPLTSDRVPRAMPRTRGWGGPVCPAARAGRAPRISVSGATRYLNRRRTAPDWHIFRRTSSGDIPTKHHNLSLTIAVYLFGRSAAALFAVAMGGV